MSAAQETLSTDLTVLALRQLAAELPLNDFGLPTGIYRTDLLPFHEYVPPGSFTQSVEPEIVAEPEVIVEPQVVSEEVEIAADAFSLMAGEGDGLPDVMLPQRTRERTTPSPSPTLALEDYRIAGFPAKSLQNAFVPLQYDEGFPAFEDGRPFWGRLDFEPGDAYLIFQRYLMMSFGVAPDPDDEEDFGTAAAGTRSIERLILQASPNLNDAKLLRLSDQFKQYYHLYYWSHRTKSYDLFRVTEYRQKQELRAIETHDDHYIEARKLRKRLTDYMTSEDEFWEMMTPKTAIDMHKHLTQLERVSAGVPASGPQTKDVEGGGKSFEVAFRTIAQDQHGDSPDGGIIDQEGSILDKALDDKAATKVLQELIIRGNT